MTGRCKLRITIVFFVFCSLYSIIAINLYVIQIKQHNFYSQLATQQYNVTITKKPPRAPILDRSGKYLALNKERISAFILPKHVVSKETLEPFLQTHFPNALDRFHKNPGKQFMYIKRKLTDEQIQHIKNADLFDIKLLTEPSRFYPISAAASLIGLTDIDNNGLFGMELHYNTLLAGSPTTYTLQKDARSGHFYFEKETKVAGQEGKSIQLTIDSDLQFLAHEELQTTLEKFNAKEGAIIIMDPKTGEIFTMVTYPHFDPHHTQNLDLKLTKNTIVTDTYELGSVFKVFSALAALEEGVVVADEPIDCKNKKTAYIDGRRINTVIPHGIIPFIDVVALSNNIGIAIVAKRLHEKLYDHYLRMGFGKKTGITFLGEQSGFINHPSNWSKQSIISLSYGYEISATIMQLARAFCMIANNGYLITPTLILDTVSVYSSISPEVTRSVHPEVTRRIEENEKKQLYSQESIDTIKNILEQTTRRGTSKRAAIKGYRIMSKTGTAIMLVDGQYTRGKNLFTCAGIVEKDDYQRVVVVFVKEVEQKNLYAATVAAPLFERVTERMLIHERVM